MDNFTIFTKTAKGLGEALGKTKNLSREQRKILKEIDGKASMGDLLAQIGMDESRLQAAIGRLLADDYIREFGSSVPSGARANDDTVFGLTVPAKIEVANSQLTIGDFFRAMEQPQSPSQTGSLDFKNLPPPDAGANRKAREEEAAQVEQARRAIEEEARRITEHARQQAAEMARRQSEQEERQAAEQARLQAEAKARQEAELARRQAAEQARLQAEEQARLQEQARAKQEAEAKARREAEELARREAEAQARKLAEAERQAGIRAEQEARRLAEEAARRAAEERERERARLEAEEQARKIAEEQARKQQEEQARLKAEEEARLAAEARAREEAEERKRVEAEQARLAAEARAREEAEAQARREAEKQARKKAEEQAQKAAQEQARIKAWEAARRAAEELAQREAEAKAKAEAERQERLRAEEEARLAAEEQARLQAEEEVRRQAEERARREAEERACLLAEEQARLAAEEQARREAEAQAEREARERARKEAEEAARLKAEEKARQKAEAKARKEAEAQARRDAREQARREAEEKARLEAERKAQQAAETKARKDAEQQARREAREKERQDAEEAARLKAEEEARAKVEKAAFKAAQKAAASAANAAANSTASSVANAAADLPASPDEPDEHEEPDTTAAARAPESDGGMRLTLAVNFGKLLRRGALAMSVLAAAGLALLHVVPFNGRLAQLEQDAGAQFGQPVKIGSLKLSLFPHPHWRLQQVAIGGQAQIAVPQINAGIELGSLFSGAEQFKAVELISPAIDDEGLGWILFGKSANTAWQSASLAATDVRLRSRHVRLPAFDARAELDGESGWRKLMLSASAEKLHIDLQRAAGALRFELTANDLVLPFGGTLAFDSFNASGAVAPDALEIDKFTGVLYDGTVRGSGVLRWRDGWSLTGDAQARQIAPAKLAPALLQSGALDGSFKYAMQASEAGKLLISPQVRGSFNVGNGVLLGVDLASQVMGQAGSGKTSFNEVNGDFTLAGGKLQLSRMRLAAGLLSAGGDAAVDADGKLSGRFTIDLRTASRQAHSGLNLSGTPGAPQFGR